MSEYASRKRITLFYCQAIICCLVVASAATNAQSTSDRQIAEALLGKSLFAVHPTLDNLKVWYHYHMDVEKVAKGRDSDRKIYSISIRDNVTKVYSILVDEKNIIQEIVINFRHDDRGQVEDLQTLGAGLDFHIGIYSTDVTFRKR